MTGRERSRGASGAEIRGWLDEVWGRTEAAVVLEGGDNGGPLGRRGIIGEVFDAEDLAELRVLTTTGEFANDICRCFGSVTIALLDAEAEFIGSGSVHGETDVSWERGRFRNNLEVADPERLIAFLERLGIRMR
ncbi:hypothetical protein [Streptomyces prunicolor]|uniref:Uncharacterized protein n=1 Tax=Streptomyces prunicolor TaxID=67348 RepID=A0ABU4FDR9_9ACTN|nr:hypothetical protein [Streptomyces prunicolor]MCX5237799.1 hypothetical protein [Streptomyces prunicolor]MDV7218739.1 hypothetical protein [Streptomyces prunicolor]